jgi:hypothetical protein
VTTPQTNVPVVLAIFLGVAILFLSAWYAAWKWLSPKDVFSVENKRISRLEYCRSLGGLVVIIGTTLRFRGASLGLADLILHMAEALALGVVALAACIIVVVTMAGSRRPLIRRIWRPLAKIALTFVPLFAANALGQLSIVSDLLNMKQSTLKGAFVDSIGGWLVLVVFWLAIFGLWACCYSARYFYCAGEVHPLLAPLVAIVAVTMIAVLDIGRDRGWLDGIETLFGKVVGQETPSFFLHPTPSPLTLTLIIGGWLSTIVLAGLEWRAIRRARYFFWEDPASRPS